MVYLHNASIQSPVEFACRNYAQIHQLLPAMRMLKLISLGEEQFIHALSFPHAEDLEVVGVAFLSRRLGTRR